MCTGDLKLYDCTVFGAHSGITTKGSLYIDGGVYEGYGHGGIYLSGISKTNYIYNAQINWAPMAEGTVADEIAGTNGAALYIGGASGITTYIDNCDFNMNDGNGMIYKGEKIPFYGIVLRTSGGEDNNTVYISAAMWKPPKDTCSGIPASEISRFITAPATTGAKQTLLSAPAQHHLIPIFP